jgi:hypothetical protein
MAEPIRRPHRQGVNRFVSAFLERCSRRHRGDVEDDDAAVSGIHLIDDAKAVGHYAIGYPPAGTTTIS